MFGWEIRHHPRQEYGADRTWRWRQDGANEWRQIQMTDGVDKWRRNDAMNDAQNGAQNGTQNDAIAG